METQSAPAHYRFLPGMAMAGMGLICAFEGAGPEELTLLLLVVLCFGMIPFVVKHPGVTLSAWALSYLALEFGQNDSIAKTVFLVAMTVIAFGIITTQLKHSSTRRPGFEKTDADSASTLPRFQHDRRREPEYGKIHGWLGGLDFDIHHVEGARHAGIEAAWKTHKLVTESMRKWDRTNFFNHVRLPAHPKTRVDHVLTIGNHAIVIISLKEPAGFYGIRSDFALIQRSKGHDASERATPFGVILDEFVTTLGPRGMSCELFVVFSAPTEGEIIFLNGATTAGGVELIKTSDIVGKIAGRVEQYSKNPSPGPALDMLISLSIGGEGN